MTDRRLYLARWLFLMTRYENKLQGKVGNERNRFVRQAAKEYRRVGHVSNNLIADHKANLADLLLAHYKQVVPTFGDFIMSSTKHYRRYLQKKSALSDFHTRQLEWARTRALENASTISGTDMQDVQNAIVAGLDGGLGQDEIASAISDVTEMTAFRAATVARTETHQAATFGAVEEARNAEKEIGINLVKGWVPTIDNRTRPAHADMANSEDIPLEEKFTVDGEQMDRPGDPEGSAENTINCRCAIIVEEARK